MTERKVLNKYYPPDYDPRLLPKLRLAKNRQYVIRTMAPFNMHNTCGEYIYKGKKFNARKETVQHETYLGLEIYRFYIRCPRCLAEITFKTDLEHCDYAEEHGAKRLFEAQKIVQEAVKAEAEEEERDKTDPMRMLEKRTKMSRFEMDALARLEELRELNQRQAKVDYAGMLGKFEDIQALELKRQEEEDEAFVRSVFGREEGVKIKRIIDDHDDLDLLPSVSGSSGEPNKKLKSSTLDSMSTSPETSKPGVSKVSYSKPLTKQSVLLSGLVRKKNPTTKPPSINEAGTAPQPEPISCAKLTALAAYDNNTSSSDDD